MIATWWFCSRCGGAKATAGHPCPQPYCDDPDCSRYLLPLTPSLQGIFKGSEDWGADDR
jgi:hypothetical protein